MSNSREFPQVEDIRVSVYKIPTDAPEADGTYSWHETILVLVETMAADKTGLGYTYADTSTAQLIHDLLADIIRGRSVMDIMGSWQAMTHDIRNLGRPGIAAMAISAVDTSLWDLKAQLLNLPLVTLLGASSPFIPVYGSGGFTSYSIEQLQSQLSGWVNQGISRVKMKIGTHPEEDINRVKAARDAIGSHTELFVDANGAYDRKQAIKQVDAFANLGVIWFEEPVTSDDLAGLHLIRSRAPSGMNIAAGEYGYTLDYFSRMLDAESVDVLQADVTRCAGITGFLGAAKLAESHHLRLSPHCAPSLHAHPSCSIPNAFPLEYFHDHARIEHMLFDGALTPINGAIYPDLSRPGIGLTFKQSDAEQYRI
jgi:L-alanine-DL-glutamate epimerase-like enolase superfamily enzyme